MDAIKDFVSTESRSFSMKLGSVIASALSGFVAGVLASSIIFFTVLYISGK